MDIETACRGFSCPQENLRDSFLSLVAIGHAKTLLGLFVDRFEPILRSKGSGVTELLNNLRTGELDFEIAWSPSVGRCCNSLRSGDAARAQRGAAEFALHAGALGVSGDWEIKLEKPAVLIWDSWLLPECQHVAVQNDGRTARILTTTERGERQNTFKRSTCGDRWESEDAESLAVIRCGAARVAMLPRQVFNEAYFDGCPIIAEITPAKAEPVVRALNLLSETVAPYFTWVSRVLRRLVLLQSPQDRLRSGNVEGQCGTVYISDRLEPLAIAEMLVHESSHLYFYIVTRVGSIYDDSTQQLYYSPFVGRMRSLERILLAYHAFANVYLFYRACIDSGAHSRDDCDQVMGTLVHDLEAVEQIIANNSQLTPLGRALAEPLLQRLQNAK